MSQEPTTKPTPSAASRLALSLKIALVLFVLAVGAVAVAAWFSGDPASLPLEYEGFD